MNINLLRKKVRIVLIIIPKTYICLKMYQSE